MNGHEADRAAAFELICEREALAPAFWDAQRRAKGEKGLFSRLASRMRKAQAPKYQTMPAPADGDLALDKHVAAERPELYVREERIAVYTAVFGGYDALRQPLLAPENIDYFAFSDAKLSECGLWTQMDAELPEECVGDPVLSNRWCKMHPHLLFPAYDYSIYVDANIWIFSDLTPLTAGLDRYPVAMFRHKHRACVYDEVRACIYQKKDDPQVLKAYGRLLRSRGIPRRWGLLEASVIARRHNDPTCISLMDAWWEAFLRNSRRDQISLIDCLWTAGLEPQRIGTLGSNLQQCRLFLQMGHLGPNANPQPRTLDELLAYIGDNA